MISGEINSFCLVHSFLELFFYHISLALADFNLVASDFVRFHLMVVLNQNVNISLNI